MLVDWDDDCAHRIKWTRRGGGPEEVKFKMCFCFWSLYSVMKIVIMTKCCRSMTGSWFRSKRFRVEGAPSSLFAVLSPVKRVEEGLSPVRGAEGGLPRGALEEQRPPSLTGERREEQQSEERQEGPRYGDVKDRHEHGDDRHGVGHEDRHKHGEVEQERKPYFPSVSSSYSSTANRQGILFMYCILLSTTLTGLRTQCKISLYFQLNFSFLLKSSLNGGHNAASHPIWAKCTLKTIKARIGAFLGLSVFRPFSVDLFRGEWR